MLVLAPTRLLEVFELVICVDLHSKIYFVE
jgi:hypothetical protein